VCIDGYSQTTTTNNGAGPPAYLGWGTGNSFPLIIQHQGQQPINFFHDNNLTMTIGAQGGVGLFDTANNLIQLRINSDTRTAMTISYDGQVIQDQANLVEGARFISNASAAQDIGLFAFSTGVMPLTNENIGAYGRAANADLSIGILAQICVPDTIGTSSSAAFFNGDVRITGIFDGPSDANLKYDVLELTDAHIEMLNEIVPKTYYFDQDHERLVLPSEKQYGFMAQEVREFFPNLTHRVHVPEKYGDDGNVLIDTSSYLAVDYLKFIPLSVKWYQSQDEKIAANQAELEALENRMYALLQQADGADQIIQNDNPIVESKEFSLYPNPTDNILNLVLPESSEANFLIRVIDINGRVLLERTSSSDQHSSTLSLDISMLPVGLYEVELSTSTFSESLKFLKK
jgi:hypothetical protein